jgi:hypothetical protein
MIVMWLVGWKERQVVVGVSINADCCCQRYPQPLCNKNACNTVSVFSCCTKLTCWDMRSHNESSNRGRHQICNNMFKRVAIYGDKWYGCCPLVVLLVNVLVNLENNSLRFICLLKYKKAVRYCSKKLSIIFFNISSWTDYRYRLSIFWKPPIIFRYGNNLLIIFDIERDPLNISCNMYI